jgi:hypothetical protein
VTIVDPELSVSSQNPNLKVKVQVMGIKIFRLEMTEYDAGEVKKQCGGNSVVEYRSNKMLNCFESAKSSPTTRE